MFSLVKFSEAYHPNTRFSDNRAAGGNKIDTHQTALVTITTSCNSKHVSLKPKGKRGKDAYDNL